ncbi:MAG: oligosaccharide flippase family protein [Oscillospiraceae bacterium]|nr:oligosaccharide flippase family protein [Oscillospiraceae bacterium]
MSGLKKLLQNTVIMTVSGIIMRCVGLSYQVWLAGRVGSDGIGLFQLIASVNALLATFAISGIRFTSTRLVSEELGLGRPMGAVRAVGSCLTYASIFGAASFAIMFFGAETIGFLWIRDARTVLSLRTLSLCMPFISLSSVFSGWFIANRKVIQASVIQILEQLINIGCAMFFLSRVEGGNLEQCCAAIGKSNVIADACSFGLSLITYLLLKPKGVDKSPTLALRPRMLKIALPLALSAYARVSLTSLENLLIPRKLRMSGMSAQSALSGYGIICGMVFPVITFPSCILAAAAELSISELTAGQVKGNMIQVRKTVKSLLKSALLFSLAVGVFMFIMAEELGIAVYKSIEAGRYIRIFEFLVPIMYMDFVTDGCLKGLGQMLPSMIFNVCEAALGVIFVIILIPRYALGGYIFVLFFCECFNFCMSMSRLIWVCRKKE